MAGSGRASDVSDAAAQADVAQIDRAIIRFAWAEMYIENDSLLEDRRVFRPAGLADAACCYSG